MSTEKTPFRTRAPKQANPRRQVNIYLTQDDLDELEETVRRTSRNRSSIVGERYNAGKAQELNS